MRETTPTPSHTDSRTWTNPRTVLLERWVNIEKRLQKMEFIEGPDNSGNGNIQRSPFVPSTFLEYVQHCRLFKQDDVHPREALSFVPLLPQEALLESTGILWETPMMFFLFSPFVNHFPLAIPGEPSYYGELTTSIWTPAQANFPVVPARQSGIGTDVTGFQIGYDRTQDTSW